LQRVGGVVAGTIARAFPPPIDADETSARHPGVGRGAIGFDEFLIGSVEPLGEACEACFAPSPETCATSRHRDGIRRGWSRNPDRSRRKVARDRGASNGIRIVGWIDRPGERLGWIGSANDCGRRDCDSG
jgi:hypothetical protein